MAPGLTARTEKTTTEPFEQRSDWPAGWDDASSDFYVRPDLRAHYRRDGATDRMRLRNLAAHPFAIRVRGRGRMVEPTRGGRDEDLFLHVRALETAAQAIASARTIVEREAYRRRAYGCELCGDDAYAGMRSLPGMTRPARVCRQHWQALEARSARWVAEQRLADGRTAATAIEALFEAPKEKAS